MITIAAIPDASELDLHTERLLADLQVSVYRALDTAARSTADEARRNHWFRNFTGRLEASIHALPVVGDVWSDAAYSQVVSLMDYASYVNDRRPFIEDAWAVVSREIDHEIEMFAAPTTL